ncbi:MAG TPA: ankyrin repeat domain-containing protein [Burkholderiaceae bacterium]
MKRRLVLMLLAAFVLPAAAAPAVSSADSRTDYFRAVNVDNADGVRSSLAAGIDPNLTEPHRGDTGLIQALRENNMRVFAVLVDAPGIDLEKRTGNGDNALMIAGYKANREAALALLAKGAQVNRAGWAPLHYAAAGGDAVIVKALLDRAARVNAVSPTLETPLTMAAREGHVAVLTLLLDAGADRKAKNKEGARAVDLATFGRHDDAAKLLAPK